MPARTQLAITCALEHFFALFANALLTDIEGFIENTHPAFGQLWLWHAVEETEHKAVCYDVYQAVAGGKLGYVERCIVMLCTTFVFSILLIFGIFFSIVFQKKPKNSLQKTKMDNTKQVKKKWAGLFTNLFLKIIKPYSAYFVPGFHPWQYDNSHYIREWKLSHGSKY